MKVSRMGKERRQEKGRAGSSKEKVLRLGKERRLEEGEGRRKYGVEMDKNT